MAVACVAVLALAGCGAGGETAGAAEFLSDVVRKRSLGQHGRVWESLHPDHKAVATRDEYGTCEGSKEGVVDVEEIEVVEEYDESIRIPGTNEKVPSRAVTLRVTVKTPLFKEPQQVSDTAHAVDVDGSWTWLLTPEDYDAYKRDECSSS